jgi:segregation and condensation protein B
MGETIPLFDDRGRADFAEAVRIAEALLFASRDPLAESEIAARLPKGANAAKVLRHIQRDFANRGVNLVQVAGKWIFRTALDLAFLLAHEVVEPKKLSRAGIETLAIVAYHQPVTRAEIEDIRGVSLSKGTLDVLLQTGWIRLRGRRRSPGRPLTYGTTAAFLNHFNLDAIGDLPGLDDLKGAGFFENPLPRGFGVPVPTDAETLRPDEDPIDGFPDGEGDDDGATGFTSS